MRHQNIYNRKENGNICRISFSTITSSSTGDAMSDFDLLKKLIDFSRDGIVLFNKYYRLIYINISFVKMSGYSMADFEGVSIEEFCRRLLPSQPLRIPFEAYAFRNEEPFPDFKYIMKTKKSLDNPVQVSFFKDDGSITDISSGCAMVFHEINSLIDSWEWRTKAEFLMQNTKAGVLAISKEQIITVFNMAAEHIFGLNHSEVIGKHHDAVFDYMAEEKRYLLDTLLYGIELNGKEISHCPYQQRDGIFVLTTKQIKDEFNDIVGAMLILEDLTEQKKYDQEIARAQRMAMVSEVAAGMAHEVRNPLTTVKGFLQLLNKQIHGNQDLQGYIEIALTELDRANGLISEFLSLTKSQSIDMVDTNINEIINQIVTLVESQANMQGITISTLLDQQVPSKRLDPGKIKQVFLNLAQNAMHAMPDGGSLNIRTNWDDHLKKITAEITDTGHGIPSEHMSKIFSPFFSTKESGTGLGLTLSYRIIQNHGGTIEVMSQVGVGTTFIVKLPI
ncbi:MAG: PAS domain-containing sensor histidine kinase [Bacillota bacterium]